MLSFNHRSTVFCYLRIIFYIKCDGACNCRDGVVTREEFVQGCLQVQISLYVIILNTKFFQKRIFIFTNLKEM
jgi:hypothetical protein